MAAAEIWGFKPQKRQLREHDVLGASYKIAVKLSRIKEEVIILSDEIKYDEAAYLLDRKKTKLIKIEDLIELKVADELEFRKIYYGNLYCPECCKPQLTLAYLSKTNKHFLKGFPNQLHDEICTKNFDYVESEIFEKFISEEKAFEFISARLQSLIYNKFMKSLTKSNVSPLLVKVDNKKIQTVNLGEQDIKNKRNIHQIPNKSLTAPFDDEDFGVFKIFYGNVDINITEEQNSKTKDKFYVMRVYKKGVNYTLCSLTMTTMVANFLMKNYNIETDNLMENVLIAFVAKLTETEKENYKYKGGKIIHSSLCFITTI